ncbi:MAG: YjbQ family protein, partial [Candidatus Electrothrix sp. AR5]|nr:YjbQ family protein [Candidatus Electrothrix sp. AR5]
MQFADITSQARQAVAESAVADGILYLFNPHTTAGLTINEGCDPDVQHDLLGVF